ncbi:MAG: NAD(P)H-quinone oxidoreductase [Actinomycetales bacterium]
MKAVVIREPGGPEVLHLDEVPDPPLGPGDVRIDVTATAVNRADLLQRAGHYPPPPGVPAWPGLECSGQISEVGDEVEQWQVGDQVCALLAGGGYAEQVVVPAGQVLPVPAGVSVADAAALPEVACTVWANVFMAAGLQRGETLLVHGGSSGIGTMAIQLAHALGARVAVTAGTAEKLRRCAELGADIGVNYREQDFVSEVRAATDDHGADVVLDNMGAKYLMANIEVLAVGGRIVIIGLQGGVKAELDISRLQRKRAALMATTLRARPTAEKAAIVAQVREYVWPLVAEGIVRPIIHTRFPLAEAAQAHQLVGDSGHVGKVLLLR